MRISLILTLTLTSTGFATAQGPNKKDFDTYWQRQSGTRFYEELKPFRTPNHEVVNPDRPKLVDLMNELSTMRDIAARAKPDQVSLDKTGREIVDDKDWAEAYERVKAKGLKQAGWLGKVLLEEIDPRRRGAVVYGMYYLNNPEEIVLLTAYLPAEPEREIRESGFQRALNFLTVHLPESKPQNPKHPDNGIVVPRYQFNPLPYMQLVDQKRDIDKAQGMWFLTEVLKIRPDLGRAYFDEMRDRIPALLRSHSKMVVTRTVDFLMAIDTDAKRAGKVAADTQARIEWFETLDYELFPPIRRVSSGIVDLYPSEDRDQLIAAGKQLLAEGMPQKTAKPAKSGFLRYGVLVDRLPDPLPKLGIPVGAVIVALNAAPTRTVEELRKQIDEALAAVERARKEQAAHEDQARADGKDPRPASLPSFQVEYIHQGKTKMMEIRLR